MSTFRQSGPRRSRERGATLIMALIMIVLLSLVVVSAFNLSSSNLKSVGNMQSRDESIAAANRVIEQVISGGNAFYVATSNQTFNVDINKDGTDDYSVTLFPPSCIRRSQLSETVVTDTEIDPTGTMSSGAFWNTEWDLKASVNDTTSGTSVVVRQGIRVKMSDTDKTSYCP